MILLDTSALIEFAKDSDKGRTIKSRLGNESVCVSSITVNEILVNSEGNEFNRLKDLLNALPIFSFGEEESHKSVEIEKYLIRRGEIIGKLDTFIAAICIANHIPILTLDKHFNKIKSLNVIAI
jgi:predicted nucleic acid-binding protein